MDSKHWLMRFHRDRMPSGTGLGAIHGFLENVSEVEFKSHGLTGQEMSRRTVSRLWCGCHSLLLVRIRVADSSKDTSGYTRREERKALSCPGQPAGSS